MNLLFVTQKMDRSDSVLGAYHGWVAALAPHTARIIVICLYEGEHDLPENVEVHSLGKEVREEHALVYAVRFIWLAWKLRHRYDRVFVHMNQEYLLIAGPLWKFLRKPAYFFRNHYAGSWLTDIAAAFATKVFCTSRDSYTARYRKTVLMPVGVDTERFSAGATSAREPRSILFLARIAPAKRPDLFVEALGLVIERGISFIASVYGSPRSDDERYYESLKQRAEDLGLHGRVRFHPAIANADTPPVYRAHEIFVNCSPPGMFDKTIFEAAACGALPLAASNDYPEELQEDLTFPEGDASALARRLEALLAYTPHERARLTHALDAFVARNSLRALVDRLLVELTG